MKAVPRVAGIFLLQSLTLLILARVIGNPIMSAGFWLTSPAACIGYYVDFRYIIGATAAVAVVSIFLFWRRARRSTIWSFLAAAIMIDALFAIHMKMPTCF